MVLARNCKIGRNTLKFQWNVSMGLYFLSVKIYPGWKGRSGTVFITLDLPTLVHKVIWWCLMCSLVHKVIRLTLFYYSIIPVNNTVYKYCLLCTVWMININLLDVSIPCGSWELNIHYQLILAFQCWIS